MSDMLTPSVDCQEVSDRYGRFVVEPLEKGFATTIGNALRRVLLSSLPGAAVTWVKIDGVHHEFSVVPHMKEDVVEFLLNVRALRIRPLSSRGGKMTLDVASEGAVYASAINPSANFEVVNPELHLATLDSPDAQLVVEFNVEQGKGYLPATHSDSLPIGVIPVDAIFSPIRRVNYSVEHTRVGQVTSYERLILEVFTDGTISPVQAVSQAARILVEKLHLFRDLAYPQGIATDKVSLPIETERYNTPIEQLNLSVRTFNCLKRAGITKVGELLERTDDDLLKIKNLGQKALEEVRKQLGEAGFAEEEESPGDETPIQQGVEEEEIE